MLKKLYDKSELAFAIVWIAVYCVLMSLGDAASAALGIERSVSIIIGLILCTVLFLFLKKQGLMGTYGLCASKVPSARLLWYIPLVILLTANLWFGVTLNYSVFETVLYILTMLCVGFLEELIFRGLLFNAMRRDNPRTAVLVSSLTFGMGHIINLFNGSGAQTLQTLLQIVYAAFAGFMFVMIYCRTESLVICILTHGLFNSLSAFAREPQGIGAQALSCVLITVICAGYGVYIMLSMKDPEISSQKRTK